MSTGTKNPRQSPIPTTHASKLPKFFQKNSSTRERTNSFVQSSNPGGSTSSFGSVGSTSAEGVASTAGSGSAVVGPTSSSLTSKPRKGSKFLGIRNTDKDKDLRRSTDLSLSVPPSPSPSSLQEPHLKMDDPPVIVEPITVPRPRISRPQSPSSPTTGNTNPISLYASTSSSTRIGDLPTRLSGWFTHTFSTSSTDLSLPALLSNSAHASSNSNHYSSTTGTNSHPSTTGTSPRSKASALLLAAKHGKGHLDKAMRYLLDSDSTPDKCTDPIWLIGVQHPGWEPPHPTAHPLPHHTNSLATSTSSSRSGSSLSSSSSIRSSSSQRSQTLSYSPSSEVAGVVKSSHSPANINAKDPSAGWPSAFYLDFTSRVWLTYRSQFVPIRDGRLGDLEGPIGVPCGIGLNRDEGVVSRPSNASRGSLSGSGSGHGHGGSSSESPTTVRSSRPWPWIGSGGEKGWTSDSGWGCMLRTGQSVLATSLISVWLGRDWRRSSSLSSTNSAAEYATYVQILTWFFDTPSPLAPFSVHRMALAGKEFGTDVGQWFGPSTAAGAIKSLVSAFPACGLGVSVATDATLFQTDVFAASHTLASSTHPSTQKYVNKASKVWGDRPVLLLIGVRMGLEGVNPIYHETIKLIYTFPQSVGIAGGRPSSSYYFVGTQADNLFYLDPHHARSTVPLRPPPSTQSGSMEIGPSALENNTNGSDPNKSDDDRKENDKDGTSNIGRQKSQTANRLHTPPSVRTGSSTYHAPLSPSPLQQEFSTSSSGAASDSGASGLAILSDKPNSAAGSKSRSPSIKSRFRSASHSLSPTHASSHSAAHAHSYSQPQTQVQPSSYTYHSHSRPASEFITTSELGVAELGLGLVSGERGGSLDPIQEHYITAYTPAELKTFHCERVRKMPLSGLDPSMLIGFLCKNEADWWDFRRRVGELPRTVFSVQDEPPTWSSDSDDNMGLESMSEPDLDMDFEDEERLREESVDDDGDLVEGEDDEEEQFFDTRSASTSSASGHSGRDRGSERAKSEEVDTEEDPVDPITPLPHSRFVVPQPPEKVDREIGSESLETNDIEDDWVDPSISTPSGPPPSAPSPPNQVRTLSKEPDRKTARNKKSKKGEVPVPVPTVKIPTPLRNRASQLEQEHYPFPMTQRSTDEVSPPRPEQRMRSSSNKGIGHGKRMHNARARDGGRTQSGGVKGVLTED